MISSAKPSRNDKQTQQCGKIQNKLAQFIITNKNIQKSKKKKPKTNILRRSQTYIHSQQPHRNKINRNKLNLGSYTSLQWKILPFKKRYRER